MDPTSLGIERRDKEEVGIQRLRESSDAEID